MARYELLKDGQPTGVKFSTKLDAARWKNEHSEKNLDWSAYFTWKVRGDRAIYKIVDIKTQEEPKNFDWSKMK